MSTQRMGDDPALQEVESSSWYDASPTLLRRRLDKGSIRVLVPSSIHLSHLVAPSQLLLDASVSVFFFPVATRNTDALSCPSRVDERTASQTTIR